MRVLIPLLLLFAAPSLSFAQFYNIDIGNSQEVSLPGEQYVIISHATQYWDEDSSAKAGTRALLNFGKLSDIPIVTIIHSAAVSDGAEAAKYYVKDDESDVVVESEAGQHKISFENAKDVFFAGGNITLCLCEAIRDTVRGNRTVSNGKALNLYLVRDAIYDWNRDFDPISKAQIPDFIKFYFVPSFKCPSQNYYDFPDMKLSSVRLDVDFDGEPIDSYDLEPNDSTPLSELTHVLKVHFVKSADLLPPQQEGVQLPRL